MYGKQCQITTTKIKKIYRKYLIIEYIILMIMINILNKSELIIIIRYKGNFLN